jgi:hypothetical protein
MVAALNDASIPMPESWHLGIILAHACAPKANIDFLRHLLRVFAP